MNMGTNKVQAGYQGGGGPGNQSVWPKVLKITGIGCAVLFLVGAVLTGVGVFQVASCCSDLGELEAASQEAQDEGYRFAMALHEGDYDGAYDKFDETVKRQLSREEFEAQLTEYRLYLDASRPFPVLVDIDEDAFDLMNISSLNTWLLSTSFREPDGEEVLHLYFAVKSELDDDEMRTTRIMEWHLEVDQQQLRRDRFVQTAESFHDRLGRHNYEQAQHLVASDGYFSWLDQSEFVEEISWLAEELDRMVADEVVGIYPRDANTLVVRMLLTAEDGSHYHLDYVVNWRPEIHDVSELVPVEVQPEVVEEPVESDGEDEEVEDQEVEDDEEQDVQEQPEEEELSQEEE